MAPVAVTLWGIVPSVHMAMRLVWGVFESTSAAACLGLASFSVLAAWLIGVQVAGQAERLSRAEGNFHVAGRPRHRDSLPS
jgi:hypothetical protein